MTSLTKSMNMSGMAGRSSEHKNSHTSAGNDSDSSFSADFDVKMKIRKVGGERLTEADFGGHKDVWSKVVIGEIFAADGEHELTWENETTEVQLSWSGNCNLEGQEGIACDNGSGFAGWDDEEKCYLRYNTSIDENEHCMRIVEIETVPKPKGKASKADRKAARAARKAAKKVEKAKAVMESALSSSGSASSDEEEPTVESKRPIQKLVSDDEEADADSCVYEFTKGKSQGESCGKSTVTGSDMCAKHKKAADKKTGKGKIENSGRKGEKSSDMAASTQTKNMQDALMSALSEILTGALKDKYATKALAALQTDEAQAQLAEVIKTNMPTKVIRTAGKAGGRRSKKDPAAPKRGCSSYIFFCKDARADVKEDNPDMKGTEVTKELGRIWREDLSTEDKKKYEAEAMADKERYIEEMKDYTPSAEWLAEAEAASSDSEGGKKKRNKSNRKPGPKRARSAYIFFCTDMRSKVKEDNEDMDAKEVTAELGRMWREEYKEDAKLNKKYTKQAKKDKKRFEQEKVDWVDPEPSDDVESFAPEPKKKSSKKKSKAAVSDAESSDDEEKVAEPVKKSSKKKKSSNKKAAPSPFTIFCQQTRQTMREENAGWSMKKVTKEMECLWASMDADEQAAYAQ